MGAGELIAQKCCKLPTVAAMPLLSGSIVPTLQYLADLRSAGMAMILLTCMWSMILNSGTHFTIPGLIPRQTQEIGTYQNPVAWQATSQASDHTLNA